MPTPLLQTKLYVPPPRPERVSRPRLIERLDAGLGQTGRIARKLTLVSAPAGFGKTTLVGEWVAGLGRETKVRVAWLSLDESDNDLARFLTYCVAALQTVEASIGRGVLSALESAQPPPSQALLTTLVNEIAGVPGQIVLVLDDYHLVDAAGPASAPIHHAISFLLRHLPSGTGPVGSLHLVIVTREDPPLPLARLRARGQLTELRATDLRFTPAEASEFLNRVMGLDLVTEDIAALERRTEGWIAGLQLAALALRGTSLMQGTQDTADFVGSFTGSHRYVLDYLIEEVLDRQSRQIQDFLMQTAILDRLTGPLCDAVRAGAGELPSRGEGTATGQETLEYLDRASLFVVPLDDERRWYRYHRLFADLLRQRLRQAQPERAPGLHRRASDWYERNGFAGEAIEHALRGGYFARAADLVEVHLGANYERVDQSTLQRWLADMPGAFVSTRPHLCLLEAWSLFTGGQLDAAEQSLCAAEKALDPAANPGQLAETDRAKLVGRVAAIRAFIASYSGDLPETIRTARQALERLPDQELEWRTPVWITLGDAYASQGQMGAAHEARSEALAAGKASGDTHILLMAHLRLAEILRQQGKLQQVLELCERQWKSAQASDLSESAIAGWLLGIWGEVLAERNDRDRALDRAQKGVERTAHSGDVLYEAMSKLCLVRVLFSSGDTSGAQDVLQSIADAARERELPLWVHLQRSAWQVRVWLAQGELAAAVQWLAGRELGPVGELGYPREVEQIACARILIAQGRLGDATRLLQRLLEAAEAGDRKSRAIEMLLLQALAFQAGGDRRAATNALEHALVLAEPGGFVRAFVDEGPPMAGLLAKAAARGPTAPYARRLLVAFPATEPGQAPAPSTRAPQVNLIEPLSERELEVLELIAQGLTNPEIASRLYIALNTVKGHTRNIYGKLGAHNRTQAVARARALGVLSST